ncbi:hypothetical protein [Amycolatopsis sp. NPDC058986]|uniref:hypothetical protein n=1 Tax=unclassified Amycolatopsis TaxID=2618356 RepID=UPI0036734456
MSTQHTTTSLRPDPRQQEIQLAVRFAKADLARDLAHTIAQAYPELLDLHRWLIATADALDAGGDEPGPLRASQPRTLVALRRQFAAELRAQQHTDTPRPGTAAAERKDAYCAALRWAIRQIHPTSE